MTLLEINTIFEMFDIKCLKELEFAISGEVIGNWNDLKILYVHERIHIMGKCSFNISHNDKGIIKYTFQPKTNYSVNVGIWTIAELVALLLNLQKYYPRGNESDKLLGLDCKEIICKVREELLSKTKATLTNAEWLKQNNTLRNESQYKEQEILMLINELDGLIEGRTIASAQNAYDLPMLVHIDDNEIDSYLQNPAITNPETTFCTTNLETRRIVNNERSFFRCEFTRRAQIGLLFSYAFAHYQTINSEGTLDEKLIFSIYYNQLNIANNRCKDYTSSISADYDIKSGKVLTFYLNDNYLQNYPGTIVKDISEEYIKTLMIQYLKEMIQTLNEYCINVSANNKRRVKSN